MLLIIVTVVTEYTLNTKSKLPNYTCHIIYSNSVRYISAEYIISSLCQNIEDNFKCVFSATVVHEEYVVVVADNGLEEAIAGEILYNEYHD